MRPYSGLVICGAAAHPDDQRLARPSRRIWTGRCPGPFSHRQVDGKAEDPEGDLPEAARLALTMLVDTLRSLEERIRQLDAEIARRAREDEDVRRLATIPGVGPITATALVALAPCAAIFQKGATSRLAAPDPAATLNRR